MKSSSFKLTVTIKAKPKDVFAALTDSKQIAKWSGQKGKVAPKVGGKFGMFDGWVKGTVVEFKPGKSLAYSWLPGDWPEGAEESIVRYSFSPVKSGTEVVLEHSNFPNESQKKSHKSGWKDFVFDPIKAHFSNRR
jgi:uncharacterized protein YndB with AHSA1/START domain